MPVSFADGRSPSAGRRLTSPPTMALVAAKELLRCPRVKAARIRLATDPWVPRNILSRNRYNRCVYFGANG